jgi:hypothetical protein
VLEQTTIRARRDALATMPKNLSGAFRRSIRRIEKQPTAKKKQAMDTLTWVFLAETHLTVDELRHALSIRPGDKQLHEDGFPTPRSILDCCLGLVIIDEATSFVRLIHKSLEDYFKEQFIAGKMFREGHTEIARTYLTYLGFSHDDHREENKRLLHRYAIKNWGHHMRKKRAESRIDLCDSLSRGSEIEDETWPAISALLKDDSNLFYGYFP